MVTNITGDVLASMSYEPWGGVRQQDDWLAATPPDNPTPMDLGFGGHHDDGPFVDMGGRHFDSVAGVFLSPDNHLACLTRCH